MLRSIHSDHLNGIALLTVVTISKFTGKQIFRPLDDSPLIIREIKERELNTIEENVKTVLSKCEKLYQCPGSSLNNLTVISVHQKSL
ncbi:MAG: hypothetical protein ACR5KV_01910 [Wolbachia sp.]